MTMTEQEEARRRAIKKLTFYLRLVYVKCGLLWTEDNNAEIEFLVDELIAASQPAATPGKDGF
jgi:hypothetical protein